MAEDVINKFVFYFVKYWNVESRNEMCMMIDDHKKREMKPVTFTEKNLSIDRMWVCFPYFVWSLFFSRLLLFGHFYLCYIVPSFHVTMQHSFIVSVKNHNATLNAN